MTARELIQALQALPEEAKDFPVEVERETGCGVGRVGIKRMFGANWVYLYVENTEEDWRKDAKMWKEHQK